MGVLGFVVFFAVLAVGNVVYKLYQTDPIIVPPEEWWGLGDPSKEDKSIVPFKIHVPDEVLEDLRNRLKTARPLTPSLEGAHQNYGINSKLLKDISNFWLNKYDWRGRERFLNLLPQFTTQIQGLKIHYLHVRPSAVPANTRVIPLLLAHGWPGSVREFYEIIPLLTTPRKDQEFVFEVVAPSMPGYGWSEAASRPGLGIAQVAVINKNLMTRLGFQGFYIQGGDWGSAVASLMGKFYPDLVKGIHLNMCMSNSPLSKIKLIAGSFWPSLVAEEKYHKTFYPLSNYFSNILLEFGYMHLQATKPDTVGVALNDSPLGLAAYILEKFTTWTNAEWKNRDDGGLKEKYTYAKLLDNVMIYWVTNSITSSMRLYAESLNKGQNALNDASPIPVPSACAIFDKELILQTETLFKDAHPKLAHSAHYSGGHFAAFEVPDILANDVWTAVQKIEKAANVKK